MAGKPFRPMLASDADLSQLDFSKGILASPKLDGIRAIVRDGVVYSRSNKPIANKHVQKLFGKFEHFDGELIVGEPTAHDVYHKTSSGVRRVEGEPDVSFYVFDHIQDMAALYHLRSSKLKEGKRVIKHEQRAIHTLDELLAYESETLELGYEGLILRDPNGHYKQGRSTAKEGLLLKLKRFVDSEFEIVGFEERMHNQNEAKTSELGLTKRSSHKANKVGRGDLGALVVKHGDLTFNVGTGFDDAMRAEIWNNRDKYLGELAKVKYFPVGVKDLPRHPVFLGFRDRSDV